MFVCPCVCVSKAYTSVLSPRIAAIDTFCCSLCIILAGVLQSGAESDDEARDSVSLRSSIAEVIECPTRQDEVCLVIYIYR